MTETEDNHKNEELYEVLLQRIEQLERLVANQAVDIRRLKMECRSLSDAAATFAQVVELLQEAGLSQQLSQEPETATKSEKTQPPTTAGMKRGSDSVIETYEDSEIFGKAPSSVTDAADAAGAALLAGILSGKQQLLIDVRDAELSRDPDTLVNFIELTILPVAAGLEGLETVRNRVKIVFPTLSQLHTYRKTMTLSAPEVVALSTLALDPIEDNDNMVILVAPYPDDEEGLAAMNELLNSLFSSKQQFMQPVVVINYHMVPVCGVAATFEVAYHLRLLSVQYMSGDASADAYFQQLGKDLKKRKEGTLSPRLRPDDGSDETAGDKMDTKASSLSKEERRKKAEEDAALESAMEHAREIGINQGVTRAMVIRAFPRPWHVFVDISPDSDTDFEVAATFDQEPSQDEVNIAIVECLEGSEREDELVAQQMQQALEAGQLNKVAKMLGPTSDEEDILPSETPVAENDDDNFDDDNDTFSIGEYDMD